MTLNFTTALSKGKKETHAFRDTLRITHFLHIYFYITGVRVTFRNCASLLETINETLYGKGSVVSAGGCGQCGEHTGSHLRNQFHGNEIRFWAVQQQQSQCLLCVLRRRWNSKLFGGTLNIKQNTTLFQISQDTRVQMIKPSIKEEPHETHASALVLSCLTH